MPAFTKPLTLIFVLAMAAPLAAQEATAPDTNEPEATTEAASEPYVAETFDAWELRCMRAEQGVDPCQLYQLLKDKETDKPIMEISLLALPEGGDAAAGATVITPLETLLTQKLNISVDGGASKRYEFAFCAEVGCVARVGLTNEDLDQYRKGSVATITVVPVADPSRTVDVDISLKGFTAAFEALAKSAKAE